MAKRQYFTTPRVRLAFPSFDKPSKPPKSAGEAKFEGTFVYDPETASAKDKEFFTAIKKEALTLLKENVGEKVIKSQKGPCDIRGGKSLNWPLQPAETRVDKEGNVLEGFEEGKISFKARSSYKPKLAKVVRGDDGKNRPKEIDTPETFYPGCYVRAKISIYWYKNASSGIGLQLENVVFVGEGERLGGSAPDVEETYDDDEFDDIVTDEDDEIDGEEYEEDDEDDLV